MLFDKILLRDRGIPLEASGEHPRRGWHSGRGYSCPASVYKIDEGQCRVTSERSDIACLACLARASRACTYTWVSRDYSISFFPSHASLALGAPGPWALSAPPRQYTHLHIDPIFQLPTEPRCPLTRVPIASPAALPPVRDSGAGCLISQHPIDLQRAPLVVRQGAGAGETEGAWCCSARRFGFHAIAIIMSLLLLLL